MDVVDEPDSSDLSKAVESLKQVVIIVTGITITNTVVIFLTAGDYTHIKRYHDLKLESFFYVILLLTNIVRFYHGNIRFLDETYETDSTTKRSLAVDFFVIFMQSVLFATMSFYIDYREEFFGIFIILLFSDVIWFILTLVVYRKGRIGKAGIQRQGIWTFNNIIFAALLSISFFFPASFQNIILYFQFLLVIINTAISYRINWKLYFPDNYSGPLA